MNLIETPKTSIYNPKRTKHKKTDFKLFNIPYFEKFKFGIISVVW